MVYNANIKHFYINRGKFTTEETFPLEWKLLDIGDSISWFAAGPRCRVHNNS